MLRLQGVEHNRATERQPTKLNVQFYLIICYRKYNYGEGSILISVTASCWQCRCREEGKIKPEVPFVSVLSIAQRVCVFRGIK